MGDKKKKTYVSHIVPGTHWDREWRYSFQETRQRLVDLVDRAVDTLEKNDRIKAFTLDGQFMALQDYLDVKPESKARLQKLVKAGRIEIGPWYSLPDVPVLTGESIVRNLHYGIKLSRDFGGCLMEGFTSSAWGQISQMPQICRGFGLDSYFSYHGVPAHKVPVEFYWQGADDSRVLFIRAPKATKTVLWQSVRIGILPTITNEAPLAKEGKLMANTYRMTDRPMLNETPFYGDDAFASMDHDQVYQAYRKFRNSLAADTTTGHMLVGDLQDITHMHPDIVRIVTEIAKRDDSGDKIIFSSIANYFDKVKKSIDPDKLKVIKGEMRFPAKKDSAFRLCCPLSARMYLKQANREAEYMLTKWAEPFGVFASLGGLEYRHGSYEYAWKLMFANQSHDNIGGCSVDIVHDDMVWRYRQIKEIANSLTHRALGNLAGKIGTGDLAADEVRLIVFNPTGHKRSDILEAYVDIPTAEKFDRIEVTDSNGKSVPCEILSRFPLKVGRVELPIVCVRSTQIQRVKVAIDTKDIPALGYSELRLRPAGKKSKRSKMIGGQNWMENEYLKVNVNNDGTFNLLDKRTMQRFKQLHYFEDNGQDRNGQVPWYTIPPAKDTTISSRKCKAKIKLLNSSALQTQIQIKYNMRIPKSLDPASGCDIENDLFSGRTYKQRSKNMAALSITSVLTLRKGAKRIDIETSLLNNAMDHRLRVLFPTDIDAKHSWADSAYDVLRRPIERIDNDDWWEPENMAPIKTYPMLNFTAIASSARSLAVIADGLCEYEAVDDKPRTIAITLLRAIANPMMDPDNKDCTGLPAHGSQCPGEHTYRYSIYPHKGNPVRGGVLPQAYRHNLPLKAVQASGAGSGQLAAKKSFISLSSDDLVITAVKKCQNNKGIIVRFFNPTRRVIKTGINFGFNISSAHFADMLEKPIGSSLPIDNTRIKNIKVGPKKIISMQIIPG